MALVGVGVDVVDSSAMVEAIVGDNLIGLRGDLRGVKGARVEVGVVSTTIDPDAQFDARIVEDGKDGASSSREVTLSGREVEAARADEAYVRARVTDRKSVV